MTKPIQLDPQRQKAEAVLAALQYMVAVGLEKAKSDHRNVTYTVTAESMQWALDRIDDLERQLKEARS